MMLILPVLILICFWLWKKNNKSRYESISIIALTLSFKDSELSTSYIHLYFHKLYCSYSIGCTYIREVCIIGSVAQQTKTIYYSFKVC